LIYQEQISLQDSCSLYQNPTSSLGLIFCACLFHTGECFDGLSPTRGRCSVAALRQFLNLQGGGLKEVHFCNNCSRAIQEEVKGYSQAMKIVFDPCQGNDFGLFD
jgi:hypothetical protein